MYADITLNQGENDSVSSPEVIASGALGPCIAIGIYDASKKKGYMIHESNAHRENNIIKFLDSIIIKSNPETLEVYVAGGALVPNSIDESDEVNHDIFADRNFVEEEIKRRFIKENITIEWNDTLEGVELVLYTKTGLFTIDRFQELNFEEE